MIDKRKNKYIKVAKISEEKFREIIKCFALDLTATDVAEITNLNRKTINRIYNKVRERIVLLSSGNNKVDGEVELDESYFGAKRIRGKRGRGLEY